MTFTYGALGLGYYSQQPDGSMGKVTKLGWSQVTNAPVTTDLLPNF